jgi:hypothetical protein
MLSIDYIAPIVRDAGRRHQFGERRLRRRASEVSSVASASCARQRCHMGCDNRWRRRRHGHITTYLVSKRVSKTAIETADEQSATAISTADQRDTR